MAGIFSPWSSDQPFNDLVDKATSDLLPAGQEDIALNLEICDQVRAKSVQPDVASKSIKRRLAHKNPNVVLLALGLTDILIKNGGDHFLVSVSTVDFMDTIKNLVVAPGANVDVRNKALALIQSWSQLSQARPGSLEYIPTVYSSLRSQGYQFPPEDRTAVIPSAALLETRTAPEWKDATICQRCRTEFTTFNRKHHCRNCGLVFCGQCSGKTMALPWYGIGQDVRVCEGCFAKKAPPKREASDAIPSKLSRSNTSGPSSTSYGSSGRGGAGNHHRSATLGAKPRRSNKEEDDLALAIKLSLEASGSGSQPAPSKPDFSSVSSTAPGRLLEGTDSSANDYDDPDLAAAIAASLRDYSAPAPSAPVGLGDDESVREGTRTPTATHSYGAESEAPPERLVLPPSLDLPPQDVDSLLTFTQTMASPAFHGQGPVADRPTVAQAGDLYAKASAARPRMARSLDEAQRRHGVLSSMHDKLAEAVRLYERLLDERMNGSRQEAPRGYPGAQSFEAYAARGPPPASYSYAGRSAASAPPIASPSSEYPPQQSSDLYPSLQSPGIPPGTITGQQYPMHTGSSSQYGAPSAPSAPWNYGAPPPVQSAVDGRSAHFSSPEPVSSLVHAAPPQAYAPHVPTQHSDVASPTAYEPSPQQSHSVQAYAALSQAPAPPASFAPLEAGGWSRVPITSTSGGGYGGHVTQQEGVGLEPEARSQSQGVGHFPPPQEVWKRPVVESPLIEF